MLPSINTRAPLLEVQRLCIGFERPDGSGETARVVEDLSFTVRRGQTFCLVGESGCGKSVTALSVPRLLPSPPARLLGGHIFFEGRDLAALSKKELTKLRGSRIGMVFQDPMTSLNPVMRVGEQIAEGLRLHKGLGRGQAVKAAVDMLDKVGISRARERARDFPHQMSGGMRQRVMIAMALACGPALLVADEPTTALDVTVQRQILALMRSLINDADSGLLLITHDFGVVSQIADDVAVMYAGRIVEQGPVRRVLHCPAHPYTEGLLRSLPGGPPAFSGSPQAGEGRASGPFLPGGTGFSQALQTGGSEASEIAQPGGTASSRPLRADGAGTGQGPFSPRNTRLGALAGTVPDIWAKPGGCAFHPRCPKVFERCRVELPPFFPLDAHDRALPLEGAAFERHGGERYSRCWLHAAE